MLIACKQRQLQSSEVDNASDVGRLGTIHCDRGAVDAPPPGRGIAELEMRASGFREVVERNHVDISSDSSGRDFSDEGDERRDSPPLALVARTLARETHGCTGAELVNICSRAVLLALKSEEHAKSVTWLHLTQAASAVVAERD